MLSYWEQQSFHKYDHIIIGAGIVGLSTAIELRVKYPGSRVLVLERGLLPTGASTKNAGFACMGSVTELLADLRHMSEDEVVALFERRKRGLELLRDRLGDDNIGYAATGSHELISKQEEYALDKIDYLNSLLKPVTGQDAFRRVDEKLTDLGFAQAHITALIENTCEGALHTGMMMRSLVDYAMQQGIEIKTGVEVVSYEEDADGVTVYTGSGIDFKCDTLCICTNAFTKSLLPEADVVPGRGQILITKPISGLKLKGIFHFNEGYYYFREIDGRILIGGGRNEDMQGEATDELTVTDTIQNKLEEKLREIIIPNTPFEVDMRWAGIMAFGDTKQPVIQQFSEHVFGAFRMGGMGVAIGSLAGKELVALIN
ncbi:MAG: FAD-binding oxidoreductase [Chitinophagales bacterium]|nr:FAD-binding oxidoreductase [Chitinophagaceae bacterium]MCB9065979.1 FAD-binding oxidoreductase [Chitinophagales bacterium]